MNILALEFSAPERSVAVAQAAAESVKIVSSIRGSDFHGVTGMMLIDRALREASLRPPEIALIAIGLGPGSYTGIRSAIAIAQGFQLGLGVETTGMASDIVLAETARARGVQGEMTIVIDAQRGDVYRARYSCAAESCREIAPLHIIPSKNIEAQGMIVGPDASKFMAGATDLSPSAETLAKLAMNIGKRVPAEQLEPMYLRQTTFVKATPPRHVP